MWLKIGKDIKKKIYELKLEGLEVKFLYFLFLKFDSMNELYIIMYFLTSVRCRNNIAAEI